MKGIYQYRDLETDTIVYVGKDSHINNRIRDKEHKSPSRYNAQPINKILQNNLNRYQYEVICQYEDITDEELNYIEIKEILKHKFLYGDIPKFNFTIGGDGSTGYKHTTVAKKKISDANKGNQNRKGKPHSDETKQLLSELNSGENNAMYGKKHSDESKKKMSENRKGIYKRNDLPSNEHIFEEWENGMTQKELAKKYNCSEGTINYRIKKAKEE